MFGLRKNEIFSDFPDEVSNESKYITRFFLGFFLAHAFVYIFLYGSVSYLSAFDFTNKAKKIIQLILSELMMPMIYFFTKALTRNLESAGHPVMSQMTVKVFLKILAVAVFILAIGSVLASYTIEIVKKINGEAPDNYVAQTVEKMSLWEVFAFVVILAPIFEELVFRKLMIDKLSKYGTLFCVFVSSLVFGLIHGNFYQFFYAFGLGALMGFVYCTYGKIIYPILIHVFINALGSIVPLIIGGNQGSEITLFQKIYMYAYLLMVLYGGITLFRNFYKVSEYKTGGVLLQPSKSLLKSWGFWLFIIVFAEKLIENTIK